MAEGINRYSPREQLERSQQARFAKRQPDIFEACKMAGDTLAAEWEEGTGRGKRMGKFGEPRKHFALTVRNNRIVIRCLTATANGWHRIRRIDRDREATAYGHPIHVVFEPARGAVHG